MNQRAKKWVIVWSTRFSVFLAEALLLSGRMEEAAEPAEKALLFCQSLDLELILQVALEINARILAHRHPVNHARIDQMMKQAAALVERGRSSIMKIVHLMARAWIGLEIGRFGGAREDLAEARCLYLKMGLKNATGELRIVEKALAEAEAGRRKAY